MASRRRTAAASLLAAAALISAAVVTSLTVTGDAATGGIAGNPEGTASGTAQAAWPLRELPEVSVPVLVLAQLRSAAAGQPVRPVATARIGNRTLVAYTSTGATCGAALFGPGNGLDARPDTGARAGWRTGSRDGTSPRLLAGLAARAPLSPADASTTRIPWFAAGSPAARRGSYAIATTTLSPGGRLFLACGARAMLWLVRSAGGRTWGARYPSGADAGSPQHVAGPRPERYDAKSSSG